MCGTECREGGTPRVTRRRKGGGGKRRTLRPRSDPWCEVVLRGGLSLLGLFWRKEVGQAAGEDPAVATNGIYLSVCRVNSWYISRGRLWRGRPLRRHERRRPTLLGGCRHPRHRFSSIHVDEVRINIISPQIRTISIPTRVTGGLNAPPPPPPTPTPTSLSPLPPRTFLFPPPPTRISLPITSHLSPPRPAGSTVAQWSRN